MTSAPSAAPASTGSTVLAPTTPTSSTTAATPAAATPTAATPPAATPTATQVPPPNAPAAAPQAPIAPTRVPKGHSFFIRLAPAFSAAGNELVPGPKFLPTLLGFGVGLGRFDFAVEWRAINPTAAEGEYSFQTTDLIAAFRPMREDTGPAFLDPYVELGVGFGRSGRMTRVASAPCTASPPNIPTGTQCGLAPNGIAIPGHAGFGLDFNLKALQFPDGQTMWVTVGARAEFVPVIVTDDVVAGTRLAYFGLFSIPVGLRFD